VAAKAAPAPSAALVVDVTGEAQTLVRSVRHFLPRRYRLEEPNYSELFGRIEGWEAM